MYKIRDVMSKKEQEVLQAAQIEFPTYLFELFQEKAQVTRAKKLILPAVRWVMAMRLYLQRYDDDYHTIAEIFRQELFSLLNPRQKQQLALVESNILVPSWDFEHQQTIQFKEGRSFHQVEMIALMARRSSPVQLYWKLLNFIKRFPENLQKAMLKGANLRIILSCCQNYARDKVNMWPNILLMSSWPGGPWQKWSNDFANIQYLFEFGRPLCWMRQLIQEIYEGAIQHLSSLERVQSLQNWIESTHQQLMRMIDAST